MIPTILIAVAALLVGASALLFRRGRRGLILGAESRRTLFTASPRSCEWQGRLRGVLLLLIGHSRRFAAEMRLDGGWWLLAYSFETGFDSGRISHSWRIIVADTNENPGRAVVTRQPWLVAMARAPMLREIRSPAPAPVADEGALFAVVDDEVAWQARLDRGLGRWFSKQPSERSWEILPGLIVGHEPLEPAMRTEPAWKKAVLLGDSLTAAARELAELLRTPAQSH